jgi:hypothetical protein
MRNPTNHSRWMRLATHSAALTALTAATAACGSASGVASPVGATVPAPPGAVAVTYITDLATHRLAAATELVLPAGRSEFRVYADIIATRRPGSVRGLTAGSVSITGSTAVVNLTGTICLPSSGSSSSAGTPDCLTQTGPHASNPFFQVTLTKAADGDWYVGSPPVAHGGHIPSATASAPAGYSSATASAPAGYSSATASAPAGYSSATASPVGGSSATASPAG